MHNHTNTHTSCIDALMHYTNHTLLSHPHPCTAETLMCLPKVTHTYPEQALHTYTQEKFNRQPVKHPTEHWGYGSDNKWGLHQVWRGNLKKMLSLKSGWKGWWTQCCCGWHMVTPPWAQKTKTLVSSSPKLTVAFEIFVCFNHQCRSMPFIRISLYKL